MEIVKWVLRWLFRLLPLAVIVALLHFYLPGHDVVRIVGTEVSIVHWKRSMAAI